MKNKRVAICATRRADDIAKKVLELGFEPFIEDVVMSMPKKGMRLLG
jgi:uroporphyrinogen-III synthase